MGEFLQWRAEELAMIAQETAEVNAEVRDYETRVRREQEICHLRIIS